MSDDGSKAGEIARYSFLHVFANDATIDADELAFMKRLALADDEIDDEERTALSRIFARVSKNTVEPDVWADIQRFKDEHGIP